MKHWKEIIYAIAVALLFIPMVFLGVNTFFPDVDLKCDIETPCIDDSEECKQEQRDQAQRSRACWDEQSDLQEQQSGGKYIVVMLICIVALVVTMLKLDRSIVYGLFSGVVVTAFFATLAYMESRSIVGFFLMVGLFVLVIVFIQRRRK